MRPSPRLRVVRCPPDSDRQHLFVHPRRVQYLRVDSSALEELTTRRISRYEASILEPLTGHFMLEVAKEALLEPGFGQRST